MSNGSQSIGYNSIGGGGINNQKMALIGLFITAFELGTSLSIPDLTMMDQVNKIYNRVPFDSIFDPQPFMEVADRYGIPIVAYKPSELPNGYDKYFWKAFGVFANDLYSSTNEKKTNLVFDLLASFKPRIKDSYIFSKLVNDIFSYKKVSIVAQFRIEADWFRHCSGNLKNHVKEVEDNYLTPEKIVEKILKVFPHTTKILTICDEAALMAPKEVIKQNIFTSYGIELIFKSDFLTDFEMNLLQPLHLSLLDFELALKGEHFIGISRSTFSNMVALQSYAQRKIPLENHYIYNCNSASIKKRTDNGCFSAPAKATNLGSNVRLQLN